MSDDLLQEMAEVLGQVAEQKRWEKELSPNIGWALLQIKVALRELDVMVKKHCQCFFDRATLEGLRENMSAWKLASPLLNFQVVLKLDPHKSFDMYGATTFKSPDEFIAFMEAYKEDGIHEGLLKNNRHSIEIRFSR